MEYLVKRLIQNQNDASEDAELLKAIRRTAVNELRLLDSIGTAQMSAQLEGKVAKFVKEYSGKITSEADDGYY